MTEIWKDIKGYEGLYQISSYGRVKSLERIIKLSNNFGNFSYKTSERMLQLITNNKGYYVVSLVKNKQKKQHRVHQLVAKHFLNNENNFNCINHIDGDKKNNHVNNLEYCTDSHNIKEAYRIGLKKPNFCMLGKLDDKCPNSIPVNQLTIDGVFIKRWNSSREAMRQLNMKANHIMDCCMGKRKSTYGYRWEYADNE